MAGEEVLRGGSTEGRAPVTPITTRSRPFERTSKRRKGYPSETRVKRAPGNSWRTIKGGEAGLLAVSRVRSISALLVEQLLQSSGQDLLFRHPLSSCRSEPYC